MSRHVVGIVRVGARFAVNHSDARVFEGRSRYSNLSPRGRPLGWLCAGEGPTAMILKGPVQLRECFSLRTFISAPLRCPCRVVAAVLYTHIQPPAAYLGRPRSASERVELRPLMRATVRAVLFANELVGPLLPFTGEVAIGEMVAVKALVGSAVGAVEDGEGEAR